MSHRARTVQFPCRYVPAYIGGLCSLACSCSCSVPPAVNISALLCYICTTEQQCVSASLFLSVSCSKFFMWRDGGGSSKKKILPERGGAPKITHQNRPNGIALCGAWWHSPWAFAGKENENVARGGQSHRIRIAFAEVTVMGYSLKYTYCFLDIYKPTHPTAISWPTDLPVQKTTNMGYDENAYASTSHFILIIIYIAFFHYAFFYLPVFYPFHLSAAAWAGSFHRFNLCYCNSARTRLFASCGLVWELYIYFNLEIPFVVQESSIPNTKINCY